jgi:mycofactocin system glycosyltransferase
MTSRPAGSTTWRLAAGVRWLDETTVAGGAPYRVITMTSRGATLLRDLLTGTEPDRAGATDEFLNRLQAAGLLLSPAPPATTHLGVTVVIPARSAPEPLQALLATLPRDIPVIVVDDGSPVPLTSIAKLRNGIQVLRHTNSRGPAAARNAGAALVRTPWIAFIDADTMPDDNWIAELRGRIESLHNHSPEDRIVLAAPRIYPLPGSGPGAWFEHRVCALDLGAAPCDVGIGKTVSYVPSAALLVDTDAFRQVGGFDEGMQVGEDVDLVWRLAAMGRIRYLPDVRVGHRPRGSLRAALNRRRVYGTSAADLAGRYPGALRHVDVSIWSFGPWLLAIAVHPLVGVATAFVTAVISPWGMPDLSAKHARRLAIQGHLLAGGSLGRWLIRPMLPATVIAGLLFPRLGRRLALAAAAGLGYLVAMDVRSARAKTDSPATVARLAAESLLARSMDDAAYSVGVWQGVLADRTLEPVLPRVRDLPRLPERWSDRIRRWRRGRRPPVD